MQGSYTTLTIRTPEGITFSLPLAGPVTRFFAWAIDLAVIAAASLVLRIVTLPFHLVLPDITVALVMVVYFGVSMGYGMAFEWFWRGQTLGKKLLGLRVVDQRGLRLRFSQVAVRNLLRAVDSLPVFYLVGGIACVLNRYAQRLGDYAANTVVIRRRAVAPYDASQIGAVKYNSFRDYPHLEARLRRIVSQEEAALAVEALMSRDSFEPNARTEVFRDFADHFRSKVTFPEDATLGLTDEQYVRNAVDSLFRDSG